VADLHVSYAELHRVGLDISSSATEVFFATTLQGQSDKIIVSDVVIAALAVGARQQAQRASITAETLLTIGAIPSAVVEAYSAADHSLAAGIR
jgi:hypothetical protein